MQQTHLRGTARQALTFSQSVFGGELVAVSYRDAHSVTDETEADQIMWWQVQSEAGFRVMGYDVPAARPYDAGVAPYVVPVRGADADEA